MPPLKIFGRERDVAVVAPEDFELVVRRLNVNLEVEPPGERLRAVGAFERVVLRVELAEVKDDLVELRERLTAKAAAFGVFVGLKTSLRQFIFVQRRVVVSIVTVAVDVVTAQVVLKFEVFGQNVLRRSRR